MSQEVMSGELCLRKQSLMYLATNYTSLITHGFLTDHFRQNIRIDIAPGEYDANSLVVVRNLAGKYRSGSGRARWLDQQLHPKQHEPHGCDNLFIADGQHLIGIGGRDGKR